MNSKTKHQDKFNKEEFKEDDAMSRETDPKTETNEVQPDDPVSSPETEVSDRETNEAEVEKTDSPERQETVDDSDSQPTISLNEYNKVVAERDEYLKHLQRLQAEFDNFRRRVQKERGELRDFLIQDLITRLLDVVGNMERALEPGSENGDLDSYKVGVQMVYKQFMSILGELGLAKIETVGAPFDPRYHEAVGQIESDAHQPGTIVQEITPGYKINDRVIQAPKVQVAAAPATATQADADPAESDSKNQEETKKE